MKQFRQIKDIIPLSVRRIIRKCTKIIQKVELRYLETHLTDHCNLNCKGCGHFAPLADKWFADVESFKKDMNRLYQLFGNIRIIRLMGGEPLLHPEVECFLMITRIKFPKSNIRLVTNGYGLLRMSNSFFQACRINNIGIDWTVYPPIKHKINEIKKVIINNDLDLKMANATHFFAHRNLYGNSDPEMAMKICRSLHYYPFFLEGKLYPCPLPALAKYFNRRFKISIPNNGYINIHTTNLSKRRIISTLNKPIDACRFCSYELPQFDWALSLKNKSEWDAASQ